MTSSTPSVFDSTSLFQNRSTRGNLGDGGAHLVRDPANTLVQIVLTPVDLDHEPRRIAGEVDNQMIDRYLAPKVETVALECAQAPPELSFDIRLIATQAARTFIRH
jgi:hypothetical protein